MIQIYLVQHGLALSSVEDSNRPLSNEGRGQLMTVAKHLQTNGVKIDKIAHSGKLRALQSAEIFASFLNVEQVIQLPVMHPNDNANALIKNFSEDGVMYVGHLPQLDRVVSHLLCETVSQPVIKFQNAAVACLQLNDDDNRLAWYLTPGLCK